MLEWVVSCAIMLHMLSPKNIIKQLFPSISRVSRKVRIINKRIDTSKFHYKLEQSDSFKTHKVYFSQSLLMRKLGDVDMQLQESKVVNLKLAIPQFNNIVIHPRKTFSFWKIFGEPTYKKGYVDGMLLADGKIITGVGGGICQLANMIHWLFLHTGMDVIEHWHHDYDVFPDSGRCLPFGSGAGVLYNYFDLQYYNPTYEIYTLNLYLTETHLKGEIFSNKEQTIKYSIEEDEHRFYKMDDQVFRENKLFKLTIDKKTGKTINRSLIKHNNSKVLYDVSPDIFCYNH